MLEMFGRGVLMGMAIAAPVGPIGVLCIRHTLLNGRFTGLIAGLGAATADGIYGCIAGLGLSVMSDVSLVVSDALINHQRLLGVGGGLFLGYLGIKTFFSRAATLPEPSTDRNSEPCCTVHGHAAHGHAAHGHAAHGHAAHGYDFFLKTYLETLLLTLANPATILSFSAIFVGLGIANTSGNYGGALALVFGVFVGSVLWWLMLSSGVGVVRDRLLSVPLAWVNRISGVIITVFGLVAIFAKF